jgi:hypothetical protein
VGAGAMIVGRCCKVVHAQTASPVGCGPEIASFCHFSTKSMLLMKAHV